MKNKIYIAVDFDECLVDGHLSVLYGNAFDKKYGITSHGSGGTEVDTLYHLLNRYEGKSFVDLNSLADEIVGKVSWREGAQDFLKFASMNDNMDLQIVSSGLDIPISAFLRRYDINPCVLACNLSIENGICLGARSIVSANDKRRIVEEAQIKYGKNRVLAIGHSSGDFPMMSAARSVCIPCGNKNCESVAEFCSNSFYEIISWLENFGKESMGGFLLRDVKFMKKGI